MDELESERINLLICKTCKTIKEIPYTKNGKYLGEGRYDQTDNPFLEDAIGRCGPQGHMGILTDVNFAYWMTPKIKESIVAQIKEQFADNKSPLTLGLDALGTGFYDLKDTYSSDAMSCWQLHNRTKDCADYKAERKLLDPGTTAERRAEGLDKSTIKVYLCDFCPYKMMVQKKAYEARGMYK
jgi:hypothetical protein